MKGLSIDKRRASAWTVFIVRARGEEGRRKKELSARKAYSDFAYSGQKNCDSGGDTIAASL